MLLRAVVVFALLSVFAEPSPAADAPWIAQAEKAGLSRSDIEKLAEQRVLITNRTYRQVFSPYVQPDLPPFVTSDSILDGYFALLEESLSRMERANATLLPEVIESLWKGLESGDSGYPTVRDPEEKGLLRARVFLATAGALVGVELPGVSEEVSGIVGAEVARVEAARGPAKPAWLGAPDPGFLSLDYRRFKPRGIYTRSDRLARYFRAVSWLQAVPFRLERDTELSAILLIARGLVPDRFGGSPGGLLACRAFLRRSRDLAGPGDDLDLLDLVTLLSDGTSSPWSVRAELRDAKRSRVNDQDAYLRDRSIRVISATATPDAVLFSGTPRGALPTGLEVAALLGSARARSLLDEKAVRRIEACRPLLDGDGLFADTLRCLAILLEPPDERAPGWMSGAAWQVKTLNTGLSGWARLRHSLALHLKINVEIKAIVESEPAGGVEPVPEFFQALGRLAGKAEGIFLRSGALGPDPRSSAEVLREVITVLERALASAEGLESLSFEDWDRFESAARRYPLFEEGKPIEPQVRAHIEKFRKLAEEVSAGRARFKAGEQGWLVEEWGYLRRLCERLETIARKELSGEPLRGREIEFLTDYGGKLARLYGYRGNSWLLPRDDAPRVADVYVTAGGQRLLAGVARARALYVLWNTKAGDVLLRGAVRPYYEFLHGGPMTDAEWRSRLDSEERPDAPSWLGEALGEAGLDVPDFGRDK